MKMMDKTTLCLLILVLGCRASTSSQKGDSEFVENMPDDTPTGRQVTAIVEVLEQVQRNPGALAEIERLATSCQRLGSALQMLMTNAKPLFVRKPDAFMRLQDFDRIASELRKGNAIQISIKFPRSLDHVFTIEPIGNGNAHILHAWQDMHKLRVENPESIDSLVGLLKRLPELDFVEDKVQLQQVLRGLFGADHAAVPDIGTSAKRRISFETVMKCTLVEPLTSPSSMAKLSKLSDDLSEWYSTRSSSISARWGAGVGAGLGFVFGAGGVFIVEKWNGKEVDYTDVGMAGLKSGLVGGVGGAAGTGVAKAVVPTFRNAGVSVVRSNVAAGVAMFGVLAIWDVVEWEMNKLTYVELRQRLAEDSAATAGGVIGGVFFGAVVGMWLGPVGMAVGALIGGLGGSILGMFAGEAIDGAIWDESKDAVMNSYEFFGWHDVSRNTRPTKSAMQMGRAYDEKLNGRPEKIERSVWQCICQGHLMVLLPAMHPEFKVLMKMANQLKENKSSGLSSIGTMSYKYFYNE